MMASFSQTGNNTLRESHPGHHTATVRFYEELNDFLPVEKRKTSFLYSFFGHPSVKDSIEALGVPHTEVDLILVNGQSVDFTYRLRKNDRISVYPVFESFDISPVVRLRPRPLRRVRFVLDTQLGKLAKRLRMLGFDTLYHNDFKETDLIKISASENRILLTRNKKLLKRRCIDRGFWIRTTEPDSQVREIVKRLDLFSQCHPFTRCLECNTPVKSVSKKKILGLLKHQTAAYFDTFTQCSACGKVYWKGSHYERMRQFLRSIAESRKDCSV